MNTSLKRALAGAGALAISGGLTLVAATPAMAATAPPWQPESSATTTGTLSFYDASGNPVTGGSITQPIAAYTQGSAANRAGDVRATLYGYTPVNGVAPGAWSGEQLSATSAYPDATAPGSLGSSSLPLVKSSFPLANLIADFPNNDTTNAGYIGVYELRVKTKASDGTESGTWEVADVQVSNVTTDGSGNITGGTWSLVYPTVTATDTTTTLAANPTSGATAGSNVTLTASVSPAAAGSVQFKDGGSNLGSPVTVASGSAQTTVQFSTTGTHNLSAVFTPTSTAYNGSTGTLTYTVGAAPAQSTTTALGVNPTTAPANSPVDITATVTPSAATGTVQFFDGTTSIGSKTLSGGSATLTYSLFTEGAHTLHAVFTSSSVATWTNSTSADVAFTATAGTGPTPSNSNLQAEADAGSIVITSPYSSGAPLDLGTLKRSADATKLATDPVQFGSSSNPIQITDTRAGNPAWNAYVQSSDFTSGSNLINGQNLGLTGLQYVETAGNALSHTNVSVFDNAAADAVSASDGGSLGLKGSGHKFAAAAAGNGTIGFYGTLRLTAPTSTAAGVYTATLTFTVG